MQQTGVGKQNRVIGLKRTSPILREAFYSLIMLSTKLIDINWDKTILMTCMQAKDKDGVSDEQAQRLRMIKRQQEALDLVYERMFKKFAKELFKGN